MILKKPYALLIKNFKKIHLVLLALMIYIVYASSNILGFFNDFIATGTFTRTSFSLSSSYVSVYMFLVAFFIAAIAFIIYILMRQKQKPKLLYLAIILYYLGLIVYYFYIYNILGTIEVELLSPRSLRVIRDIVSVVSYLQYSFIILIGIRAVGFNIRKFNFGEDLQELEIDVTDNEEFELTVGLDRNKISRGLRRRRRELKYFVIENFFVLLLISIVVVTTAGITLFLNLNVYNKVYQQAELFRVGSFVNKVNASYYTNINQKGELITSADKTFVVLSINFSNRDTVSSVISLDNIDLISGNKIFRPITTRYQSFVDLGVGYIDQTIKASESVNYIFVFEVDKNIDFNKVYLRYRESLTIDSQKLVAKYRKIKLEGVTINKITNVENVALGDTMSFKDTVLNNTTLKFNDIQIENSFVYDVTYCSSNVCTTYKNNLTLEYTSTNKSLMKLSFEYNVDAASKLYGSNSLANLIKTYGHIRYKVDNKVYNVGIVNETPTDYRGKDLYYQVPSSAKGATTIELILNIRDKELIYKLK